jgi:hypothetical protein
VLQSFSTADLAAVEEDQGLLLTKTAQVRGEVVGLCWGEGALVPP